MLECVINLSEGRDLDLVAQIAAAAGPALLDVHSDADHNRSVLTLLGEGAARAVASATIERLDLTAHIGVHPRLGVVDVVPFVALHGSTGADALAARDRFAQWLSESHSVPCFLYGPERSLPEVRRSAFRSLQPDAGPTVPHLTAGATAVGQRPVLVAYNVWVAGTDLDTVRRIAAAMRSPQVRSLGLQVGARLQVSMNLIAPSAIGPADAYDRVATLATARGTTVLGAELVGLLPRHVLNAVPQHRWDELDLSPARTIEARLDGARSI